MRSYVEVPSSFWHRKVTVFLMLETQSSAVLQCGDFDSPLRLSFWKADLLMGNQNPEPARREVWPVPVAGRGSARQ